MADDPRSPTRLPVPSSYSQLPMPSSQLPMPRSSANVNAPGNKRRSLLLPRGSLIAASQRGGLSGGLGGSNGGARQRPMTMMGDMQSLAELSKKFGVEEGGIEEGDETDAIQGDSASGDASSTSGDQQLEKEDARAAAHARLTGGAESRTQSTISKPKTGISRSQSIRKPGTISESTSTRPTSTRSHARNGSNAVGRPLSTLTETSRTTRTRPESSASASSAKSPDDPIVPRTKFPPPTTTNGVPGLRRANTTTTRHTRTQSALPTASTAPSSGSGLPRPGLSRQSTTSDSGTYRPAFSTLQQHFSPQKNRGPKPASTTLIHSQPVDTGSSLGLETQFLQARLLQLSILHREALPTLRSWEESAKLELSLKFQEVGRQCDVVQHAEKQVRTDRNVQSLKEWCNLDSGLLAENLAVLSGVVGEVFELVEEGARVEEVLGVAGEWIQLVESIWELRDHQQHDGLEGGGDFDFIEGLGETWEVEAGTLIRKMGSLARVLDGLEMPRKESSLYALMIGVKQLIQGALEELRLVVKIEKEVVEREKRWVDERVRSLEFSGDIEGVAVGGW